MSSYVFFVLIDIVILLYGGDVKFVVNGFNMGLLLWIIYEVFNFVMVVVEVDFNVFIIIDVVVLVMGMVLVVCCKVLCFLFFVGVLGVLKVVKMGSS